MDEYLFIQWSKLQADRRRLELEQQATLPAQQTLEPQRVEARGPSSARRLLRELPNVLKWRAQS